MKLSLVALAAAVMAGAAHGGAARPTVLPDCLGHPQVKPDTIVLACGDGNESVSGLEWTGWGSTFAAGRGTISIDDCTPNCAAGHDHFYRVVVLVSGHQTCTPGGKTAYAKVTIAFLDSKPHTTLTQTFPCRAFK
jgi:hypothetical protein